MKIFCDLDGTLIDVSVRHYKVYCDVVELFSGSQLSRDKYWSHKRNKNTWEDILKISKISEKSKDNFLQEFIKKIEDPIYLSYDELFEGAVETLKYFSKSNNCYLVSLRRNQANLKEQLVKLDIDSYFKKVLSGHSENDGYDVKIELIKNELTDEENIIIGDTEADIITGKKLNMITVATLSGLRDSQFLSNLEPDYMIDTIADIRKLNLL